LGSPASIAATEPICPARSAALRDTARDGDRSAAHRHLRRLLQALHGLARPEARKLAASLQLPLLVWHFLLAGRYELSTSLAGGPESPGSPVLVEARGLSPPAFLTFSRTSQLPLAVWHSFACRLGLRLGSAGGPEFSFRLHARLGVSPFHAELPLAVWRSCRPGFLPRVARLAAPSLAPPAS
jgi:hypothetical protein